MALLPENVPEDDREFIGLVIEPHILGALHEIGLGLAASGDAGKVALHVGREYRDAGA